MDSEEKKRHNSFLAAFGGFILENGDENRQVDLTKLPDTDVLERFFTSGWEVGKLYADYIRQESSSRRPG